jgi:hypothetical protein
MQSPIMTFSLSSTIVSHKDTYDQETTSPKVLQKTTLGSVGIFNVHNFKDCNKDND